MTTRVGSRRARRLSAVLVLVLLCLTVVLAFAGVALAEENVLAPPPPGSPDAPELDYEFAWWSFALTFGLVILFYIFMFVMSEKEFKAVILERFGPRR